MLECFFKIRSYVERLSDVIEEFPTLREIKTLEGIMEHLEVFNSVTTSLQREDLDLSDARALFDAIIEKYPTMKDYLAPTSNIVHTPDFENAVVKILNNELSGLTRAEEKSVVCFFKTTKEPEPEKKRTAIVC